MKFRPPISPSRFHIVVLIVAFALTLTVRVWGISSRFWLLGDQMRDWEIALRPFSELPLVGPATHVGGYTIGPAFYWILWLIRVCVGPWFENLPHAGGIGQAILQSATDALLLFAVWKRTQSVWTASAVIVLLASASYDLALSALVWNPVVGSTLAKMATALVLLEWHRKSMVHVALTAAIAWSAVHAYTGAIFVAVSVFAVLLVDPLIRDDKKAVARSALMIVLVVVLLQLPYVAYQIAHEFRESAMGAVSGSVGRILFGGERPQLAASVAGYTGAVGFIQVLPWHVPFIGWVVLVCGVMVAVRYRRDPLVLGMTLLPQLLAIAGYAFFLAALDNYYYLSLMPAAVLTLALGVTATPWPEFNHGIAVLLCFGALLIVPERLRFSATLHRMPEYRALVAGSRTVARRGLPMRAIETEFRLPPTGNSEFIYHVLGGKIDRKAPWIAVITAQGDVIYRQAGS